MLLIGGYSGMITHSYALLIIILGVNGASLPTIELRTSEERIQPGAEASFNCRIQNQGFYKVTLEKHVKIGDDSYIDTLTMDDNVVEKYANTGRFVMRKVTFGTKSLYILEILNVTYTDSAKYVCKLLGASVRAHVNLSVYEPAQSVKFDKFQEGDIITFTEGIARNIGCSSQVSMPSSTINLKIGDRLLSNSTSKSQAQVPACWTNTQDQSNCFLHYYYNTQASFKNVVTTSQDDGKMLTCQAQVNGLNAEPVKTQIEISVLYAPKIYCGQNFTSNVGSSLVVNCSVFSYPAPTSIIWSYLGDPSGNTTVISTNKIVNTQNINSRHKSMSPKEQIVSLRFPELFEYHFTTFTLHVTNSVSNSSHQIMLIQGETKNNSGSPVNGGDRSGVPFYAPVIIIVSLLSLVCITACKR